MDESVLDPPAMDTMEAAAMEAAAMAGEPPGLEGYADMAGLEEGQQVMLQLPDAEREGTESVIMEVVRVDGNQIHFIAPDPAAAGGGDMTAAAADDTAEKTESPALLQMPDVSRLSETDGETDGEMEEVESPCCFLCLRPPPRPPLHCLVLNRTEGTGCPLLERLSSCAAPLSLQVSTSDGVCDECLALINFADQHYHQYQLASEKLSDLVRAGDEQRRPTADDGADADAEATPGGHPKLVELKEEPPPSAAADDSDSDWAPAGPTPRSTRSRVPKARQRWSPEPIERPTPAPKAAGGVTRGRGRPRKHPAPPTVIEYTDIDTLKEQVKDIKTDKFDIKSTQLKQPLKSDLEKIIHLEVRAADGGPPAGAETVPARGRGRPPTKMTPRTLLNGYECRRCEIQFRDSGEMVKHLRQHVNKPWCKRCRTEFPNRQALLDHRRGCRLKHRSGRCEICCREVDFLRYHMRRHSELVQSGAIEEGAAIPEEEDHPPSFQRRMSRLKAGGVCSICGEYVPQRLRKHERSHNVTHTCPICKKEFTREDVVRGHIKRVHMKERPHVCATCGKTFVSVYSLQRHEMIHNNEYRFYCQECGDGFRQKQQLTAHMRHKHGVVDVVFEDVQVMPEGTSMVDALSVITEQNGAVLEGAIQIDSDQFDKEEYVIAAADADGDEHIQFTAVQDEEGNLRLET